MMNGFMYGNVFEEEERFQRQVIFPKLLCQNAEDFSFSRTSFNRDNVKAGTGRRFLGGLLDDSSYCYTLEVSFYSFVMGGTNTAIPYTEEAYMKLGRNVARTFADYYKLTNLRVERPQAPLGSCSREQPPALKGTLNPGAVSGQEGGRAKRSRMNQKDTPSTSRGFEP
ncbi:cytosolic carboxypeptidase 6-like [Lissotriton helveticus]